MANTIVVEVPAMFGDADVTVTNVTNSGAIAKKGTCVLHIDNHEAAVNIEVLLNAVIALEKVNGK